MSGRCLLLFGIIVPYFSIGVSPNYKANVEWHSFSCFLAHRAVAHVTATNKIAAG